MSSRPPRTSSSRRPSDMSSATTPPPTQPPSRPRTPASTPSNASQSPRNSSNSSANRAAARDSGTDLEKPSPTRERMLRRKMEAEREAAPQATTANREEGRRRGNVTPPMELPSSRRPRRDDQAEMPREREQRGGLPDRSSSQSSVPSVPSQAAPLAPPQLRRERQGSESAATSRPMKSSSTSSQSNPNLNVPKLTRAPSERSSSSAEGKSLLARSATSASSATLDNERAEAAAAGGVNPKMIIEASQIAMDAVSKARKLIEAVRMQRLELSSASQ